MASRLNRGAWRAFDAVFDPWMRHHVRVCIAGTRSLQLGDDPVMLVSNHVSWWDGFLLRAIQKRIRPESPFYSIALERELSRQPLLRLIGGIGIVASSPSSILGSMRELERRCLEDRRSVIGFFPQGCITPSFRRPLGFNRGIELFARRLGPLTIIPVALHIEPLNGMAPTAFVRVGEPELAPNGLVSASALQERVSGLLDSTLAILSIHGENSTRVWEGSGIEPAARELHRAARNGAREHV